MKKILVLFTVFILTITSAFALSKPRWQNNKVKVYIPQNHYYSRIMKQAFIEWQEKSKYAVCFDFLNNKRQKEADITVHFVEKNTNCDSEYAIGCTNISLDKEDFYAHNDIYIASKRLHRHYKEDGTAIDEYAPISSVQVYNVMLHEVGHAIGIHGHSNNPDSIMYVYSKNNKNSSQVITEEDVIFINNVYR